MKKKSEFRRRHFDSRFVLGLSAEIPMEGLRGGESVRRKKSGVSQNETLVRIECVMRGEGI